MIKINGNSIESNRFPDGTLCLMNFDTSLLNNNEVNITWLYENDAELFKLICITKYIQENTFLGKNININLHLNYVPNSRLDRIHSNKEIFTLKYFCDIINSLKFDNVFVFDPHSYVTEALINNIRLLNVSNVIKLSLRIIESYLEFNKEKLDAIYFPDDGAYKRYNGMDCFKDNNYTFVYGKKNRDWSTGKILGLDVCDANGFKLPTDALKGKNVLMIDDIISYGGTLAYSADKLKELGAEKIYIYASHTENSVLDKEKSTLLPRLNDGTIEKMYTTNSIYTGTHDKIALIQRF